LRMLGLYPPGSYVRLASQEVAVVIRRGAKAHTPIVACVRRADATMCARPLVRDTSDVRFAVQRGLLSSDVRISLNQDWVLAAG